MQISEQTQAVLLLTAWLGKPADDQPQPLTIGEWARFALWLHGQGRAPADLLTNGDALRGWDDPKVSHSRIGRLLERSAALAISLERWQRTGLWVLSRSDAAYPRRLKQRLKHSAPPILYGAGNATLLESGGVAVVGARDAREDDLAFAACLGAEVAAQAGNVVSGGARGVDESAMLGALEAEGTAVGVLAENLLRASSSKRHRSHLADGNLALISPFNPETGFSPANAMARNRYIYCLADAAIVVASASGKGGTWSGANENLRNAWVPLWIRPHQGHAGNIELIRKGAGTLPALDALNLSALMAATALTALESGGLPLDRLAVRDDESEAVSAEQASLPPDEAPPSQTNTEPQLESVAESEPVPEAAFEARFEAEAETAVPAEPPVPAHLDFYLLFLHCLRAETRSAALTVTELQERLQLNKSQLAEWLARAVDEEQAERLARPVRYRASSANQPSLGF